MPTTFNLVGTDAIRARFTDFVRLGDGAEGGAWAARDPGGRQVVLKRVEPVRRASVARAFEVLRGVGSPHLPVPLELIGEQDGGVWLVTGYVDGEPLGPGPIAVDRALAEALGVAHGLAAIQALGTHHGDVSANNVLVTATNGVVLTDLGQLGCQGGGTPGFIAPEVLRGGGGPAADWFGLGSLLCLRLFGQVPWRRPERLLELTSGEPARVAVRHRLRALAEAADLALAPPVQTLLERLLAPDPSERITDARLIVARLGQLRAASSTGELLRASAPWWLPNRWRFRTAAAVRDRIDTALASIRRDECRLVLVAGPAGSGRGRIVEELIQRLQIADTRGGGTGESSARLTDPDGLVRELSSRSRPAAGPNDWIETWMSGSGPDADQSGTAPAGVVRGFTHTPAWPARLDDPDVLAAVLRAGADLGAAVLIIPVDVGLGERLAGVSSREPDRSIQVIDVEPWSREQTIECLADVIGADAIERGSERTVAWAAALLDATGGWPARVVRAIEAVARTAVDDHEPDRALIQRALIAVGTEAPLDSVLAREVLDRCWGAPHQPATAALPDGLVEPRSGMPLATTIAAARATLSDSMSALARTTLAHARESGRAFTLALALDADDAEAVDAWFDDRTDAEFDSDVLGWLDQGGIVRVGPRLRLRAIRELIRRGQADRALATLAAIGRTGTPSLSERIEGVRAREQLGRGSEALEQLADLIPLVHGPDRDRAMGLRWRALVDGGRAVEARNEALVWAGDNREPPRKSDWRRAVAWLWGGLAVLQCGGDAQPFLDRARSECNVVVGQPVALAVASLLARVEQLEANLAQAAGANERARTSYRAAGDWFAIAGEGLGHSLVEGSLAALALEAGEFDEAVDRGRRACRGFLARAQVQTLPAVLFNLVRALIAIGAIEEGRRLLGLVEQLCTAAGEPSQLVRARLRRAAIELDVALQGRGAETNQPAPVDLVQLGDRMATCAASLDPGAPGEAIDTVVAAAVLARVAGDLGRARERLADARMRMASLGESVDPAVRLGVELEGLAQSHSSEQLRAARAALADLDGPVALWGKGQRLLAFSYDRTLLGTLHRFGCIGDGSSRPVARRLIDHLETIMAKAPTLDRRALRHSLLSEAGEAGPLRELVRELEASEAGSRSESPDPSASEEPAWAREPTRPTPDSDGQLARLLKIFRRLAREDEVPRLLEQVVEAMMELTNAERGVVVLGRGGEQIAVAREFAKAGEAVDFSRSVIDRVLAQGEPVLSVDAATDDRFDGSRSISHLALRSVLAVPLVFRGELLGAAYVDHRLRRGNFDANDLAHMEDFADLAALAIAHARSLADARAQKAELERRQTELAGLLEQRELEVTNLREVVRDAPDRTSYRGMVGNSQKMQAVFRLIDRMADSEAAVVIHGESGTGKELVARAIHEAGPRKAKPFVAENCGAIAESLLESVLFGHARGAFTGAQLARPGLFEAAEGGTIFLDEIGETSPAMQTMLLRVLQEGEVRRIGENRARAIDVRVIAASNRSLERMVEQGTFRQDLYYRINVVRLELPSLRERREDIPALIEHFLSRGRKRTALEIPVATLRILSAHAWPGNVRELENEVARWRALCEDRVLPEDLSPAIGVVASDPTCDPADPEDLTLGPRVARLEREIILRALDRTHNQNLAAQVLGISRFGLQKKLKRLGIEG